jgi:hypothetical protein
MSDSSGVQEILDLMIKYLENEPELVRILLDDLKE